MGNITLPEHGDAWLNNDTKSLKYHLTDRNYTVTPEDWFIAGEDFASSGSIVSIKSDGKVWKTDSDTLSETIGINLNSALTGEKIEVQRSGLYVFETVPFTSGDIGKTAYVMSGSPDGQFTTDRNLAAFGGHNVIEIGQVVAVDKIFIAITGDSRGPLDYTEIEYIVGETIDISLPVLVAQKIDGKVVKAKKETLDNLFNVVGFIISSTAGVTSVDDGDSVIVRRMGLLGGFTGLTPGLPVFAGSVAGEIIQQVESISPYYDKVVQVGIAKSTTEIIVHVQPAYSKFDDTPIGSIILADELKTEPDSGFLWMDGTTYDATNPMYVPLYEVVGNKWGGTPNVSFVLGNLNSGILQYQIKYAYHYQFQPVYTPIEQVEHPVSSWQTFDNVDFFVGVTNFNLQSIDDLKELQVRIVAKKGTKTVLIPDSFVSEAGGVNTYYGYTVVYNDDNLNNIYISFAEDGLAFSEDDVVTVLDSTWSLKVIVNKNERLNRFRDVNADSRLELLWNDKNIYNDYATFIDLTASASYAMVDLNKDYVVTMNSAIATTVNIEAGGTKGKRFKLINIGTALTQLIITGGVLIDVPPKASVEYIYGETAWDIFNSVTYASVWNPTRTYLQWEPIFYNGVPYRSKQDGNTNKNPEVELEYWEVTGGGGVTLNGTSAITESAIKAIALNSSGEFVLADCSVGSATYNALGFVKSSLTTTQDGQILGNGSLVKNITTGLNPGQPVYLRYAGGITQDDTVFLVNEYRQHLGVAVNETDVLVAIQEPMLMGMGDSSETQVFFENSTEITANYTITSGKNAGTFGPITIADGIEVTVPASSVWTIV